MKRYLIIAMAAVLATGCAKDKTAAPAETPRVSVAQVVTDSVVLVRQYPATLTANNKVDLMARVNGTLLTQNFANGDTVERGQVLFTIEATPYIDAVNQAKAALETANSQYAYASKHYEAMKKAAASDAVSQIELLQAQSDLEQAVAAISNAKAALQSAQTTLGYCTVRAPFRGEMAAGVYSPGAYISGGAAPVRLATIYDNSALNANFYIEDASFMRMFTNPNNRHLIDYDRVSVTFAEKLPHEYTGKLTYMSPDVDTGTGTLEVRALIQNPYGELRDGMYATVNMPYKVEPHALLVRDAAISTDQLGKYVYVVSDSNTVVYTPIKVGEIVADTMRVVIDGLTGDEMYVTKALLKVRPGMKVTPIK